MAIETEYTSFLQNKMHLAKGNGTSPVSAHDKLFPFQRELLQWALERQRAAIFADCGMGKTPIQLAWAHEVADHTKGRVLILTPLAVAEQTEREGAKFSYPCKVSRDGAVTSDVTVTNYEKLHLFDSAQFQGVVCDESSCLKAMDGARRAQVTEFMRTIPWRLLCTATAAPNDYIELGTSSEALGVMGFRDMLSVFFKKATNTSTRSEEYRDNVWRFRGHAERDFWRWVVTWARAARSPMDLGFPNDGFELPELETIVHVVESTKAPEGMLFTMPAIGLAEQRQERVRTLQERCEMAAELAINNGESTVSWVHYNNEGDLLTSMIPGAVQVTGKDSDEKKIECFRAFVDGEIRVLVTKPRIAGYGMNWQHCGRQTFFPSHSYEQYYQAIRRSLRFGRVGRVRVDVITTEGEQQVLENLQRKDAAASAMFDHLVSLMNDELKHDIVENFSTKEQIPSWL